MPCRDYYDDNPQAYFKDVTEPALKKQISFAESALCQTLVALEKCVIELNEKNGTNINPMDQIDYSAAGIKRSDLIKWWNNHKKLDAKHREEERIKQVRELALSKLSDEEKKVLGVN